MSTFVRFIGSLLIFLWVAMEFLDIDVRNFFPNGDYSSHIDDLMNNLDQVKSHLSDIYPRSLF